MNPFSHQGKHYTLPPRVPLSRLHARRVHPGAAAAALPVECWQPIQGGTQRGSSTSWPSTASGRHRRRFGRGRGGAPPCSTCRLRTPALGKHIELGERLASAFSSSSPKTARQAIREAAKYYEENMKMFGELRLVRALTDEQVRSCGTKRAPTAELPRIEDAMNGRRFLTGSPERDRRASQDDRKTLPGTRSRLRQP